MNHQGCQTINNHHDVPSFSSSSSSWSSTTALLYSAFLFLVFLYFTTTLIALTLLPPTSSMKEVFTKATTTSTSSTTTALLERRIIILTPPLLRRSSSQSSLQLPLSPQKSQQEEQQDLQQQQQQHSTSFLQNQRHSRLQTIIQEETHGNNIHPIQTSSFPIHVRDADDDMEVIDHPGILFAGKERIEALLSPEEYRTFPTTMKVPKFWNPTMTNSSDGHADDGHGDGETTTSTSTVREYLGNHGQRAMTLDEALSIGSYTKVKRSVVGENGDRSSSSSNDDIWKETIFVSVASYRDPECSKTIESIYEHATYPERIRVGIVDQIDIDDGDTKCNEPSSGISCEVDSNQTLCQYRKYIDRYEMQPTISVGPVLARHVNHRMYRGEYFVLQIDAHVRFTQHWDLQLIQQWYSTNNEMAVISTYLTDITNSINPITHQSKRQTRNVMCNIQYECTSKNINNNNNDCFLVLQSPTNTLPTNKDDKSPTLHPFWSAGFSFSRGHFIVQVPYDQYLPMVFHGEESNIALRGFTYGYDFYAPHHSVAFHIYAIKDNIGRRNRHKYWEHETLYQGALEKSLQRLNVIIGSSVVDETDTTTNGKNNHVTIENTKYGIGHVRDRSTYYETFGIHPQTKTTVSKQELCGFVQHTMHDEFASHMQQNGMGIDYARVPKNFFH